MDQGQPFLYAKLELVLQNLNIRHNHQLKDNMCKAFNAKNLHWLYDLLHKGLDDYETASNVADSIYDNALDDILKELSPDLEGDLFPAWKRIRADYARFGRFSRLGSPVIFKGLNDENTTISFSLSKTDEVHAINKAIAQKQLELKCPF